MFFWLYAMSGISVNELISSLLVYHFQWFSSSNAEVIKSDNLRGTAVVVVLQYSGLPRLY